MPQGNAHALPSGIWYETPTTSSIPRLLLGSGLRIAGVIALLTALQQYRSLSWKYTYRSFLGKTMSLGTLSIDEHEPLPAEQIDRLKAEQAERKSHRI